MPGSASNCLSSCVNPAGSAGAQEGQWLDDKCGRNYNSDASGMPATATDKNNSAAGQQRFKLYQILSPQLAFRGRVFGSKLALKDEWVKMDASFFDAPGGCKIVNLSIFLSVHPSVHPSAHPPVHAHAECCSICYFVINPYPFASHMMPQVL